MEKSRPLSEKAERNFAKVAYKIMKRLAEEKAKEQNKQSAS